MLGGNNEVEAVPSTKTYSQSNAWVGKTERGASEDGDGTARNWLDGIYEDAETKIKYPVFTGTTYSMNYINHNDAFLVAKEISASGNPYNLPITADSHLMKDSEWGAVAYLGQSKYGLEDKEVCINNVTLNSGGQKRTVTDGKSGVESVYAVTGVTSKKTVDKTVEKPEDTNDVGENAEEVVSQINKISGNNATTTGEIYTWNQKSGQGASSSGTIYGIYDLSGGLWERTAAYTANGSGNLTSFGKSLLYNGSITEEKSTKYVTVYAHDSDADKIGGIFNTASQKNYEILANRRKFGNAMHETSSSGTGSTSWRGDYSFFVGLSGPFSIRSGGWYNGSSVGVFSFYRNGGDGNFHVGFRVVFVGE